MDLRRELLHLSEASCYDARSCDATHYQRSGYSRRNSSEYYTCHLHASVLSCEGWDASVGMVTPLKGR